MWNIQANDKSLTPYPNFHNSAKNGLIFLNMFILIFRVEVDVKITKHLNFIVICVKFTQKFNLQKIQLNWMSVNGSGFHIWQK